MTIAFVNKGTQTFADAATSITVNYTGATTGNLLVACIAVSRTGLSTGTLTTPAGWTAAENPASNGPLNNNTVHASLFYKENCASGSHSTAFTGLPAGTFSAGIIAEFSGIVTSASLDQHTHNNGGTTGATSGNTGTTAATTQADELVIAIGHSEEGVGNITSFTNPSSGYTSLALTATNAVHIAWSCGYKIIAATGTQTGSFTWTTSAIWAGSIATFLAAGGGGGGRTFFVSSGLDGLSSSGPKQFNPSLGYHRAPRIELRRAS